MNKLLCYLMAGIVLTAGVISLENKVMVLKLNYNQGNISLLNSAIKYGFCPDRRYQPDYGYRLEIIDSDKRSIYEFRFKAPNEIFIDGSDSEGGLSGGKIIMDDVNFALTVPYFDSMGEVIIFSPEDKKIASFSFGQERSDLIRYGILGLIAFVALLMVFFIFIRHKKR